MKWIPISLSTVFLSASDLQPLVDPFCFVPFPPFYKRITSKRGWLSHGIRGAGAPQSALAPSGRSTGPDQPDIFSNKLAIFKCFAITEKEKKTKEKENRNEKYFTNCFRRPGWK